MLIKLDGGIDRMTPECAAISLKKFLKPSINTIESNTF